MSTTAASRARSPEENPLPHNKDAEQAILGAILTDNKALAIALKTLSSGDFFFAVNQTIFRRMIQMAESGNPIDVVTLHDALSISNELRDVQEIAYIAQLATDWSFLKVPNVEHYAQIVRRAASLRRLVHAAAKLSVDASSTSADLGALQTRMRDLAQVDKPITAIGANGHLSYGLTEFQAATFPTPDHLIEVVNERNEVIAGLIPKGLNSMVFSMPHHLKSYFTTSLALACTTPGIKFGKLLVKKPVRTFLIQMEDFPGQLQWRIGKLAPFMDIDPKNIAILPRCDHRGNKIDVTLPNANSVAILKREIEDFGADLVIFDVVRRITNVDLNSQKDSSVFLEDVDSFHYCPSDPHLMLVHHENRKEADIMYASAGSYNLPGWATVMIQFKRKVTEANGPSRVEIEVDSKVAQSPETMCMILDLQSETPVRLENLEETAALQELRDGLGTEWTLRDLMEVMNLPKTNAGRRLKKFIAAGLVEKVTGGKRGRQGGLARYRFVGEGE